MSGAEPELLVAVDHPEQGIVRPSWSHRLPVFIRIDDTHELSLILSDSGGHPVARFATPSDAALFLQAAFAAAPPRLTLPLAIVGAWRKARDARIDAEGADLPDLLRHAGAQ